MAKAKTAPVPPLERFMRLARMCALERASAFTRNHMLITVEAYTAAFLDGCQVGYREAQRDAGLKLVIRRDPAKPRKRKGIQ